MRNDSHAGLAILVDLLLPVALYYALRGAGVSEVTSLVVSGLPPGLRVLDSIVRHRRLEVIGAFVLLVLVLNLATAALSGDARTLLVRSGWVGLLIACLMAGSLVFGKRPMTYRATVSLLPGLAERMEFHWATSPGFRQVWRRLAVIWTIGTLISCLVSVLLAYTLPVDSVPALDTGQHVVLSLVLQVITQIALRREGTMRQLWAPAHAGKESS